MSPPKAPPEVTTAAPEPARTAPTQSRSHLPSTGAVTARGASSAPTYEGACGRNIAPGDPAPQPQRSALSASGWSARSRLRTGRLRSARRTRGRPAGPLLRHRTVWQRTPKLRAARPDGAAALVYQVPARFAMREATDGMLVWMSDRIPVGLGDLVVFDTTRGTFVFVRSQSAAGPVVPSPGTLLCERYTSENVAYTRVVPGLVTLWLALMRRTHHWIWPLADESDEGSLHETYTMRDSVTEEIVGQATCVSDTDCTLMTRGRRMRFRGPGASRRANFSNTHFRTESLIDERMIERPGSAEPGSTVAAMSAVSLSDYARGKIAEGGAIMAARLTVLQDQSGCWREARGWPAPRDLQRFRRRPQLA